MFWFAYPLAWVALRVVDFTDGLLRVMLIESLGSEIARELSLEERSIGDRPQLASLVGSGGFGQGTEDSTGCDGQWGLVRVRNSQPDTVPIGSLQSAGRDPNKPSIPSSGMAELVFPGPTWLSTMRLISNAVWCLSHVAMKIPNEPIKSWSSKVRIK